MAKIIEGLKIYKPKVIKPKKGKGSFKRKKKQIILKYLY